MTVSYDGNKLILTSVRHHPKYERAVEELLGDSYKALSTHYA
jgi:hypothetical protein